MEGWYTAYDGIRGKILIHWVLPHTPKQAVEEAVEPTVAPEYLQDQPRPQEEELGEVNLTSLGEEPRSIFVSKKMAPTNRIQSLVHLE